MRGVQGVVAGLCLLAICGCQTKTADGQRVAGGSEFTVEDGREILGDLVIEAPKVSPEDNGYLSFRQALDRYEREGAGMAGEAEERLWSDIDEALEKEVWIGDPSGGAKNDVRITQLTSVMRLIDSQVRSAFASGETAVGTEHIVRGIRLAHRLYESATNKVSIKSTALLQAFVYGAVIEQLQAGRLDEDSLERIINVSGEGADILGAWRQAVWFELTFIHLPSFVESTKEEITMQYQIEGTLAEGDLGAQTDEDSLVQDMLVNDTPSIDRRAAFLKHVEITRARLEEAETYVGKEPSQADELVKPYLEFYSLFPNPLNGTPFSSQKEVFDEDKAVSEIEGRKDPVGDYYVGLLNQQDGTEKRSLFDSVTMERVVIVALRGRLHQLQHGALLTLEHVELPGDLGVDPYTGEPLKFNAQESKVWSVGADLVDDRGDALKDKVMSWRVVS